MKFFVGLGRYHLDLRECQTLKDKRSVVKSILDRLKNSSSMAACEIGDCDRIKACVLAVACVSPSHGKMKKSLEAALTKIESTGAEVLRVDRWVFEPED